MADITIRVSDKALKASGILLGAVFLLWGFSQLWASGVLRPKYQIRMFVPGSVGLHVGAPVRLDGMPVGRVSMVNLAGNSADSNRRTEVVLRIEKRFEHFVRDDSAASLVTEGLLGDRYISIHRGFTGSPIPPGGEIRVVPAREMTITDFIGLVGNAANCRDEEKGSAQQSPTAPKTGHQSQ
jgi:phospholipid/cholesterol/gamma-HCH transport system substrate-binding protein